MILGHQESIQTNRPAGLEEWLDVRGLPGWLDIAINGLEPPARTRISEEIEAHYAESVHSHTTAGETEALAQKLALAELGDPQSAYANFQKSHLTEAEAKWLRLLEQSALHPLLSFRTFSVAVCDLTILAAFAVSFRNTRFQALWLSFAIGSLVGFRLIPRCLNSVNMPYPKFRKWLAVSSFITGNALVFCVAYFIYAQDHDAFSLLFAAMIFLKNGVQNNPAFRIWRKIRRTQGSAAGIRS